MSLWKGREMATVSFAHYIKAIAEAKSISAAAESLKISQPALSSYLKKLEDSLGAVLFDRTKQPLEITDAGRVYLDYAEKHSALLREFEQHISDIETLKKGKLTIGGAASFNVSYFPKTVAEFTEKYPGIDIDIIDGNIPEISAKAINGHIDLFVAPTVNGDTRLKYRELLNENIFLCVPSQWSINKDIEDKEIPIKEVLSGNCSRDFELPVVDFKVFKECPFILLKKEQHIGSTMQKLFEKYEYKPKKTVVTEQTMTSYSLTLAGVGISLMTESTIRSSNFKDYPKLYMPDTQICRRSIYAMYSSQKYLSKAAKVFIEMLKKNLR